MNPLIFDSGALLSYFFGEKAAPEVQKSLKSAIREDRPLLLSPIQLAEIFYIVFQKEGADKADSIIQMLDELFFEIPKVDRETSLLAAKLKGDYGLGFSNSFAAALALRQKGDLVTGEKEFKSIEKELTIHWI